jgi:hypothetical protein
MDIKCRYSIVDLLKGSGTNFCNAKILCILPTIVSFI